MVDKWPRKYFSVSTTGQILQQVRASEVSLYLWEESLFFLQNLEAYALCCKESPPGVGEGRGLSLESTTERHLYDIQEISLV